MMPGRAGDLAPRQPERFAEVERLSREAGFVDRPAIRAAD